jgi:hypothetical protein
MIRSLCDLLGHRVFVEGKPRIYSKECSKLFPFLGFHLMQIKMKHHHFVD